MKNRNALKASEPLKQAKKVPKQQGKSEWVEARPDNLLALFLGLNAAKISLFLNSLYLVAIFSAFAKNLQKTGFCPFLKTPI